MRPRRFVSAVSALALAVAMFAAGPAIASPSYATGDPDSPSARYGSMTYDAARGQVVLFGGGTYRDGWKGLGTTWTWDGATWTKQHPVTSPSGRHSMGLTYDAARGEVLLFGGCREQKGLSLGDTWTWDGTTWTQHHPATSPSARVRTVMAYDANRGEVVLFGGATGLFGSNLGDTWTWDGLTWTRHHPAASPSPRIGMGFAYDAALGKVVLFGGQDEAGFLNDTWTWDGKTWTQQHPVTSPSPRFMPGMTYDATRGQVVLFGGERSGRHDSHDTWTWDGSAWTRDSSVTLPTGRAYVPMTYDSARGQVVLFGGYNYLQRYGLFGDTWTWDGARWRVPFAAHMHVSPSTGPPGTAVRVTGAGFGGFELVTIAFIDAVKGRPCLEPSRVTRRDASLQM